MVESDNKQDGDGNTGRPATAGASKRGRSPTPPVAHTLQATKAHKKHRQDRRAPPQDSDQDDDLSDGPDESEKYNLSDSDDEGQTAEQTQPQTQP